MSESPSFAANRLQSSPVIFVLIKSEGFGGGIGFLLDNADERARSAR
jgi:hypothetical protein